MDKDEFKSWLEKIKGDPHSAKCRLCYKTISVAGQGVKALESHVKSTKHRERLPQSNNSTIAFPSSDKTTESATTSTSKQTSIVDMSVNQLASKAEIMWSVDVVLSHYSFNSVCNKSELFCRMFSDSKIAEKFSCGKTKCSYIVCFGIAPYFKGQLDNTFTEAEHLVAMFDESFNKTSQKGQMDMHVRFWDDDKNRVATRYYNSEFMGKASAKDIFESFNECLSGISKSKLLQVSSDGPNVNLSFFNLLEESRSEEELSQLIGVTY